MHAKLVQNQLHYSQTSARWSQYSIDMYRRHNQSVIKCLYCRRKWFGYLVRPARMSTQTVTSHCKLSGSFYRPGAVYSGWLFVDLWGSSTSWDIFRSIGVPGYAAPISRNALWYLQQELTTGDHHVGSVFPVRINGFDSLWQQVSACTYYSLLWSELPWSH